MADHVYNDSKTNHVIAPGFGHAGIEPTRFAHASLAAATPVPYTENGDFGAAAGAMGNAVLDRMHLRNFFPVPSETSTPVPH